MPWCQTPSRKKKAVVFTNGTTNAYQGQLNAGFSKVCEIFKVCGIESLKYVQEFHTLGPVCYCGDISTPRNVTLNKTNCDWLFDMSVKRPYMGRTWPMKAAIYSRPSAVSLKVWLRETTLFVAAYICKLILCQQERCWSDRDRGFPGNAVHKAELCSQTLLYQTLLARWNENDIHNFLKTVGFHQK